ncbi:MAG: tRNA (guanosine(37)-N1)-methyltransferase TrmD [Puniceicoccales bacterium]|jgi:tRNA (guanine37-N1)-methyltransferase|nr:tRNA (guanosine(37)-N1)-methyltransferase TrmD [Puniceicoccales bacterium]
MDFEGAQRGALLRFDVLSLFPRMLDGFLLESVIGRAVRRSIVEISSHSIREWATGVRAIADDRPFGGGAGMVLKPEPVCRAIDHLRRDNSTVIYLCPDGLTLSTSMARDLAKKEHLILLCGHYEGIDERIRESRVDMEVSIGDYVLTNGVLPAAVLIDAICRQIPGVLGKWQSLEQDSFSDGLLSFPQYTRPEIFEGMAVPKILLSGHHKNVDLWRRGQQIARTRARRSDLWEKFGNEPKN